MGDLKVLIQNNFFFFKKSISILDFKIRTALELTRNCFIYSLTTIIPERAAWSILHKVKWNLDLNMLKVAVILSDVKLQISFNVKELRYRNYLANKFTIQCIHTHTHPN